MYLFDRMIYKKEVSWNQNTKRFDWEDPNESMVWDDTFPNISFYWMFNKTQGYDYYFQLADVMVYQNIKTSQWDDDMEYIKNTECEVNIYEEVYKGVPIIAI